MNTTPICFIGGGNMAKAIITGLESVGHPSDLITVVAPHDGTRAFHRERGRTVQASIADGVPGNALVILAVKPQVAPQILAEVAAVWSSDALLLSIMAGTQTSQLEAAMPTGTRVVRVMPNTPMAIGAGMCAVTAGSAGTEQDLELAEYVCRAGGEVLRLEESQFDAFTAVAGSGPCLSLPLLRTHAASGNSSRF